MVFSLSGIFRDYHYQRDILDRHLSIQDTTWQVICRTLIEN